MIGFVKPLGIYAGQNAIKHRNMKSYYSSLRSGFKNKQFEKMCMRRCQQNLECLEIGRKQCHVLFQNVPVWCRERMYNNSRLTKFCTGRFVRNKVLKLEVLNMIIRLKECLSRRNARFCGMEIIIDVTIMEKTNEAAY